ncbi:hypothetical protein Y11_07761 [Yersinia enterocolitica subsp. palearctica Y11]|uniref:Uncharacterized protein n=2 Tax=Yersinia enterocolitica TaxID=630 RepID=A0A0H3NQD8_YERE1|nr:unknown protein [Yersinia enterocolitica W22703]CBY27405.1 hypothetical protein Y11_07761 [Yersinia enterocolitica subsp. palearctica Y11]CCO68821.1 hypothetical protein D322_1947 [Yersinia enterocolitica IP 10393]CRY41145.1 Uncharacterised protein [Yersinia enterocolitica]
MQIKSLAGNSWFNTADSEYTLILQAACVLAALSHPND